MFISCITSDPELLVKFCQRNPKIFANVRKFCLISRYFLVFQVISRLWHIETFSFLHSMFISCITSDPELLVKFCQRNPKIIANVRTIYSAYKTYTKVQLVRFGEFEKGGLRTTASGASSFVPSSTECCRLL